MTEDDNVDDDRWRWGKALKACYDDLKTDFAGRDPVIVDREIMPGFLGKPDGLAMWLICSRTDDVPRLNAQHDELKALIARTMEQRHFPESARESLKLLFTSLDDIEKGGGRFYFFR